MSKFYLPDENGVYKEILKTEDLPEVPTKVSDLTNDSGFQTATEVQTTVDSHHDNTKYDASNPSGFITKSSIIKYQASAPTDGTPFWVYVPVHSPIGGKIFYDDGDNGATYKFYDASRNEIAYSGSNPETVLANAVSYTISGTPTKDRFYVFNNEVHEQTIWGKHGTEIGIQMDGIGRGKLNTNIALQQTGWEDNSIFAYIQTCNDENNPLNGCNDWYIGSEAEHGKLRAVADTFDITWYTNNFVWSSVENSIYYAHYWNHYISIWDNLQKTTTTSIACFAMRSF